MQKKNYNAAMERLVAQTKPGSRLLLHACCAPCATVALERLAPHFEITLYFYNPNIAPGEEYARRLRALRKLLDTMPLPRPVELVCGPEDRAPFLGAVRGKEGAPEGGARCEECFRLRLSHAAKEAARRDIPLFGTTLTVGPRKNAAQIYEIGAKEGNWHNVLFLPADFKKMDGYLRSIRLSEEYGLYRQHYCGCEYSQRGEAPSRGASAQAKP